MFFLLFFVYWFKRLFSLGGLSFHLRKHVDVVHECKRDLIGIIFVEQKFDVLKVKVN